MKNFLLLFFWMQALSVAAQAPKMTKEQYIESYARWAVWEMYEYGIPASITIAQAILESSCGNSPLAKEANNHFGIKCHSTWSGLKYYYDDDSAQECFRVYPTALESFRDHSLFLRTRTRYASLFEIDKQDFIAWAKGLKAAGYATNPKYAEILIKSIEDFELFRFDDYPDPRVGSGDYAANTNVKIREHKDSIKVKDIPENELQTINGRKCVKVNQGFSVSKLSLKHDISVDKLYKYNDITSEEMLDTGMYFYIEKKQNEADIPFHITEIGQSMFWIAQYYGIKLAKLYSFNKMEKYMQPEVGEKIYLQEERNDLPKVRTFYEVIVERNKLVEMEKQAELRRRAGADKALIEQRYRLQIEDLKSKNKEDEIKMSDMSYQILKLKEEQEKFQKNREDRRQEIEKLEKKKNEEIKINDWKTPKDTTNLNKTDGPSYKPVTRENPKTGLVYHVVEKGETLFSLSKKYNTTVEKIKAANGLGDHGITLGQELIIEPN